MVAFLCFVSSNQRNFQNRKMRKDKFFNFSGFDFIPVVFWMGVIFYFSSLKGEVSISEPSLYFYLERKGAHVAEYFILMILLINLFLRSFRTRLEVILFSGAIALIYSFSDEFHQTFVSGREGKISDIGFDLIGITLAGLIAWIILRPKKH